MKTNYEIFLRDMEDLSEEFRQQGVSEDKLSFLDYPKSHLFFLEERPPRVRERVPLEKELLPYPSFYIEYRDAGLVLVHWYTPPEVGEEGLAISLLNAQVGDVMSMMFAGVFSDHRLKHLLLAHDKPHLVDAANNHKKELIASLTAHYWSLYDFLLYLRTPVLKTTKIDVPHKRRLRNESGEKKEFESYTRVRLRKEYVQTVPQHVITESVEGEERADAKRYHWCRGHFKHYSKDKPLFGRVSGPVWTPPHTRGDAKKGVVFKSYNVTPNKE